MRGIGGKVAVITGAGQGIGRAIAIRLAAEGADVVVADMNPQTAEGTAHDIARGGRRSLAIPTDVSKSADRRRLVETTLGTFSRVDFLVNNAGIIQLRDPLDLTEEDWDLLQAVNLKGTFFTCQAVLPHMLERGSGRIVNVASVAAKAGSHACIHYNVSKAGVVTLTRNLAVAYGKRGITINCVCPGSVSTGMWEQVEREAQAVLGLGPGEFTESRLRMIALNRLETPEDVANVVCFLCSDDASYMTGQAINVTGGMIFH